MSDEVIFDDDSKDFVQNIVLVPGPPKGILSWLVKEKIVKNGRQAELLLVWVCIVSVILAIVFFAFANGVFTPKAPTDWRLYAIPNPHKSI